MCKTRIGLSDRAIDHAQHEAVKIAKWFNGMEDLSCIESLFLQRKAIAIESEKLYGDDLRVATEVFNSINVQISRFIGVEYLINKDIMI